MVVWAKKHGVSNLEMRVSVVLMARGCVRLTSIIIWLENLSVTML